MLNTLKSSGFDASRLTLVDPAPRCSPPIVMGERVQLRSGGPEMLAVDLSLDGVVVSWCDGGKVHEATFPAMCLRLSTR